MWDILGDKGWFFGLEVEVGSRVGREGHRVGRVKAARVRSQHRMARCEQMAAQGRAAHGVVSMN